jgi:predicted transglutaminase-like cysteine proteinase
MIAGSLTNTEKDLGKVIFTAVAATIVTLVVLISDASAAIAAQADISEPFELPTVAVSEGPWWASWRDLQSQIQSEKRIIAQCRAEPHSCTSPAALRFIALVKEGDQYEGLVRIGRINRAVNFALRAVNSTVQTTWTSPLSTLATGFGDCKQYAVLKYAVLDEAGFAPDDLRLVIVRIKSRRDNHAVVAIRNAAHWFILDNRSLVVVESGKLLDYYLPLVTLDHRGVRPFVLPSEPRVSGLLQWEHR